LLEDFKSLCPVLNVLVHPLHEVLQTLIVSDQLWPPARIISQSFICVYWLVDKIIYIKRVLLSAYAKKNALGFGSNATHNRAYLQLFSVLSKNIALTSFLLISKESAQRNIFTLITMWQHGSSLL